MANLLNGVKNQNVENIFLTFLGGWCKDARHHPPQSRPISTKVGFLAILPVAQMHLDLKFPKSDQHILPGGSSQLGSWHSLFLPAPSQPLPHWFSLLSSWTYFFLFEVAVPKWVERANAGAFFLYLDSTSAQPRLNVGSVRFQLQPRSAPTNSLFPTHICHRVSWPRFQQIL